MPTRVATSVAFLVFLVPSAAVAGPIPPGPPTSVPAYSGSAATPQPVADPTIAPQNPFMAPNPKNNIHNDTWMTDAYQSAGPLGRNPKTRSGTLPASLWVADLRQPRSDRHGLPVARRPAGRTHHRPAHPLGGR